MIKNTPCPAMIIPTSKTSYVAVTTTPNEYGVYEKEYVGERHTFNFSVIEKAVKFDIPIIICEDEVHVMRIAQETAFQIPCVAFGDNEGVEIFLKELAQLDSKFSTKPRFIIADSIEFPMTKKSRKNIIQGLKKNGYCILDVFFKPENFSK